MRTTVTLDPDTEAQLRRRMADRGISFKQALNEAIRAGSTSVPTAERPVTRVRSMGRPLVDLDAALRLAGELEDAELLRKMHVGK